MLSCDLIALPGQVSVGIVLPGTNNIDFQGKEGVFASQIKSFVLFMILSSVRKKMLHNTFLFLQERIGSCSVTLSIDLSCLVSSLELDLLITWRLLKARPKYFRSQQGQHASL